MMPPPPATTPFVVSVGGPPGAGKTTLGRALAVALRAALLDLDTLTNPLVEQIAVRAGAGADPDHPALRGAVRRARYECLRDTAADVAGCGCSAVLVAPFTEELADPSAWAAFARLLIAAGPGPDQGLVPRLVDVVTDPEIAMTRRALRGLPRDRVFARLPAVGRSPSADFRADGTADPVAEAARLAALIAAAPIRA